jgi:hypothetical protein
VQYASASAKGEGFNEFAENYLRKVRACHHVVGSDYAFATGCRYNRRAFVFILREALSATSENELTTPSDLQQQIELICEDFSRSAITDAMSMITPVSCTQETPLKYKHVDLRTALFFFIIFEKWLKEVEGIFTIEGTMNHLSATRLRVCLESLHRKAAASNIEEPPLEGVHNSLDSLTSTFNSDITLDSFRRALVANPIICANVHKTPIHAQSILVSQQPLSSPIATTSISVPSSFPPAPAAVPPPIPEDHDQDQEEAAVTVTVPPNSSSKKSNGDDEREESVLSSSSDDAGADSDR